MNLSKRLKAIADLVDGKNVIDVGCDHGYLDIYLTKNNIKCLATDISEYCIKKAKDKYKEESRDKETTVTNVRECIDTSLYDTIIISGMGTHTILKILYKKQLTDTLIISSNNDLELLRRNIIKLGYYIENEIYINENNKPYIIIKFKKGVRKYGKYDYIIGPIAKKDKKYLEYLINNSIHRISKIPENHLDKINYYKDLINECRNNQR